MGQTTWMDDKQVIKVTGHIELKFSTPNEWNKRHCEKNVQQMTFDNIFQAVNSLAQTRA